MPEKSSKKVAAAAAVAGVIGFAAGILFAPKSGKETRKDIADGVSKAKVEAEKRLKAAHSELNDLISDVKKRYEKGSTSFKKDADALLKSAKKAQDDVRDILSALHEGTADDPELKKALKEAQSAKEHLIAFLKKK
jgi:gas vesicle protein